jgi:DNA-binding NarL/FixJ family response regulator
MLVVMGLPNADIARRMFVSEGTVKCHLGAAFRKLGVENRAEAAQVVQDPLLGRGLGVLTLNDAPLGDI